MKKIIIAVVVVLVLGGAGAGAFFYFQSQNTEATTEGAAAGEAPGQATEPEGEPTYLSLNPAFVVNYEHNGSVRYLQIELQVMSYSEEVLEKVAANMPAVRNTLILLFSSQNYAALTTLEGKETLRGEVVAAINKQLRLSGSDSVQEAFFTNFVVQ
ncbi:MAG: flagellar basal body-associated FliL family protein [Gammaproteobacteria bacterium]|nr:flagellar basal body-associated FliL family protein [Gammaproteobacteria bacterium]